MENAFSLLSAAVRYDAEVCLQCTHTHIFQCLIPTLVGITLLICSLPCVRTWKSSASSSVSITWPRWPRRPPSGRSMATCSKISYVAPAAVGPSRTDLSPGEHGHRLLWLLRERLLSGLHSSQRVVYRWFALLLQPFSTPLPSEHVFFVWPSNTEITRLCWQVASLWLNPVTVEVSLLILFFFISGHIVAYSFLGTLNDSFQLPNNTLFFYYPVKLTNLLL